MPRCPLTLRFALALLLPIPAFAARFHVELVTPPTGQTFSFLALPTFGPALGYLHPVGDPDDDQAPVFLLNGAILHFTTPPPNCARPYIETVNNAGEAIGQCFTPADQLENVTYKGGHWTEFPIPTGPVAYYFAAINDLGDITGLASTSVDNEIFRYSGGDFQLLGAYPFLSEPRNPFYIDPAPNAINNIGQIAGNVYDRDDTVYAMPFLFQDGVWTQLPTAPGSVFNTLLGLNQIGTSLVGYATNPPSGSGSTISHLALVTKSALRDISSPALNLDNSSGALNDFDDVAATGYRDVYETMPYGLIYSQGAFVELTPLIDLPGYTVQNALLINDRGDIAATVLNTSTKATSPALLVPICRNPLGSAGPQLASAEELKLNARWCAASR